MKNKSDLIDALAQKLGTSKVEAKRALEATVEVISEAAKDEGAFLTGFGTFKVKNLAPREVRNPATGEKIQKPASKKLSFKAASNFFGAK